MRNKTLIAVVLVPVAIAGGVFAAARYFAPASDHAIELVPDEAFFYSSIFLKPSTDQRKALRDLLAHFPDAGTSEEAEDVLDGLLDEAFTEIGLSYTEEVKPWIGHEVAFFAKPGGAHDGAPGFAFLMATEDEDAARSALVKARDLPGTLRTVVDGFAVFGTSGAVRAVTDLAEDAESARSLATLPRYRETTNSLSPDRIVLAYFDPRGLVPDVPEAQVAAEMVAAPFRADRSKPLAATGYLREDAVVIDVSLAPTEHEGLAAAADAALHPNAVLDEMGEAWAALGITEFGASGAAAIDALGDAALMGFGGDALRAQVNGFLGFDLEREVLDWVGDGAIAAGGGSLNELSLMAVVESDDPEASRRALAKVGGTLRLRRQPVVFTEEGFRWSLPGRPPIAVAAEDDRVWGSWGTLDPAPSRVPMAELQRLLGEDFEVSGYVDAQAAIGFVEETEDPPPSYDADVKPNLEPLTYVVLGTRYGSDTVYQRLVIGVE